jgi:hypothetical protein
LLFFATLCSIGAVAQESKTNAPSKIPASQANDFVGSEKTVTGKVSEVNVAERLIRINFDKPFPNQTFTAVIFAAKTNLFPEVEKLKDKTVEVRGKIVNYRDRPQIVLTSTNQLNVVKTTEVEEKK